MNRQHIKIVQIFNASADRVFDILTDHETFGQVINTDIKRVVDGQDGNKNGVGSIRRINLFLAPAFEETVITFKPNLLMEYVISKGSPVKNHKGKMEFFNEHGKTRLDYTIYFEPRFFFPFAGMILKKVIEHPIRKGLEKLSQRFENRE